jgi:hypothetical protein
MFRHQNGALTNFRRTAVKEGSTGYRKLVTRQLHNAEQLLYATMLYRVWEGRNQMEQSRIGVERLKEPCHCIDCERSDVRFLREDMVQAKESPWMVIMFLESELETFQRSVIVS